MQNIGFKEWSGVCDAIRQGRQTVIIRKGGIAEGREGFSFNEKEFYLFPTRYHEEAEKIREPEVAQSARLRTPNIASQRLAPPQEGNDEVEIDCAVKVEWSGLITDWEKVQALEPFHIWREEVIRARFDYDKDPGVHVAFVRAFRLSPAWTFPNEKRFGGCRSWVELLEQSTEPRLDTVMSDEEFAQQRTRFLSAVHAAAGSG